MPATSYICGVCGAVFSDNASLYVHRVNAHRQHYGGEETLKNLLYTLCLGISSCDFCHVIKNTE